MLSDHVQFAGAMVLSVGIVVGSYYFVLTSPGAREDEPRFRRERGIEVARILLGHRSAVTTAIYAEADVRAAEKVMMEVG